MPRGLGEAKDFSDSLLETVFDYVERRSFDGFNFESVDIRYTIANRRQGKSEMSGELMIMDWDSAPLGILF